MGVGEKILDRLANGNQQQPLQRDPQILINHKCAVFRRMERYGGNPSPIRRDNQADREMNGSISRSSK